MENATQSKPSCFYCGGCGKIDFGTEPGSPEIVEPCEMCNGTGKESLWRSFCVVNDACNAAEYSGRFLARLNASLAAVEQAVREHESLVRAAGALASIAPRSPYLTPRILELVSEANSALIREAKKGNY